MTTNRHKVACLVGLSLVALFACGCPTPPPGGCVAARTKGNDEFRRWAAVVSRGGSVVSDDCWHGLGKNDSVAVGSSGEAELNFSDCWSGRIFIFHDSGGTFRTERCSKVEHKAGSANCIPFGSWYVGKCAGEFTILTGSASIYKTGTSVSITYLPGALDLSLVVVLEGSVQVTPVDSFDPQRMGPPEIVQPSPSDGAFYFTMPFDRLGPIGGLDPRRVYPLAALPPLVNALGIHDWLVRAADRAREDGVLPPAWPKELGGSGQPPGGGGLVVTLGGGRLADPTVAQGVLLAIDWQAARKAGLPGGGTARARTPGGEVDLARSPYDPDGALTLFDRAGYRQGQRLTILYPAEDGPLAEAAGVVAESLARVKVEANLQPVPRSDLDAVLATRIQAGEETLALARE